MSLQADKKITSKEAVKTIEQYLLDLVFPKQCGLCKKEGLFLCKECLGSIDIKKLQNCPICESSVTETGRVCRSCRRFHPPLEKLLISADYKDALVKKLIHQFKYKFAAELDAPLARIMIKASFRHELELPDLIIPVPLHSLRLRFRGFNQSELLAIQLARNLVPGYEVEVNNSILKKVKNTAPQAGMKDKEKREGNISQAFEANLTVQSLIKNKRILLVDDVCTTGSTLFECAKTLSPLKPKSISAIVIARQG
ncbi:MAG: ComF family protein [Candidatus Moranbacteria bacterium]|nr:ComF family protein [Candidatus Moranbacteria bacterium]